MAMAVAEARRVLRPGGCLLDIHPQGLPLRLEVWRGVGNGPDLSGEPTAKDRRLLGNCIAAETVEDFSASTRAIVDATHAGFDILATVAFDDRYFFDSLDELTDYLEDNEELELAGDDLLERALMALRESRDRPWLVLVQPVIVTSLRKTNAL